MSYIMELRKLVGHRRLMMPGAGVFLYRDGQLLLQRRRDNGLWADHGGAVELGESTEDAARRELFEETGLKAGALELLGVFSGPDMDYTYPNGDEVSMIAVYYLCGDFSGDIHLQQEEVAELRWFPLDKLPDEKVIHPVSRKPLRLCAERLRSEMKSKE